MGLEETPIIDDKNVDKEVRAANLRKVCEHVQAQLEYEQTSYLYKYGIIDKVILFKRFLEDYFWIILLVIFFIQILVEIQVKINYSNNKSFEKKKVKFKCYYFFCESIKSTKLLVEGFLLKLKTFFMGL